MIFFTEELNNDKIVLHAGIQTNCSEDELIMISENIKII
jgi:hypothetical protein